MSAARSTDFSAIKRILECDKEIEVYYNLIWVYVCIGIDGELVSSSNVAVFGE